MARLFDVSCSLALASLLLLLLLYDTLCVVSPHLVLLRGPGRHRHGCNCDRCNGWMLSKRSHAFMMFGVTVYNFMNDWSVLGLLCCLPFDFKVFERASAPAASLAMMFHGAKEECMHVVCGPIMFLFCLDSRRNSVSVPQQERSQHRLA